MFCVEVNQPQGREPRRAWTALWRPFRRRFHHAFQREHTGLQHPVDQSPHPPVPPTRPHPAQEDVVVDPIEDTLQITVGDPRVPVPDGPSARASPAWCARRPGRTPSLHAEHVGAPSACSPCHTACSTTRSRTTGPPRCRVPPPAFGISTRRTGWGVSVPSTREDRIAGQCAVRGATSPSTVIPSMPGAPRLRLTWRSARRRCSRSSTRSMRSVPSTGASAPRVPATGSSPGFPRDRSCYLSDALPRLDTMGTAPRLHSPLGAPFGPSSCGLAAPPLCCPAFRHRGASRAAPASGRRCPLLTAPSRSEPVARPPVLSDNREISQGQTPNVPRVDAGRITHTPLRMGDFAVTGPLVPGVPYLVSGSCSSSRARGLGVLQTPPRDDALALLLAFGSAMTWRGDFHPARSVSAWHTRWRSAARASGFLTSLRAAAPARR
jgi:hypothetical protein